MTWLPPSKVGDIDPLIPAAREVLGRQEYGKAAKAEGGSTYTETFGAALRQYGANVHAQVLKGQRPAPDVNVNGVFDWAIKRQMGIDTPVLVAPPKPKRLFPAYVWRGTGGIIGQDYVSQVCQPNADRVEEINIDWAATMGGLPVGTAGQVNDPSMWAAVQHTLPLAQSDFIARRKAWPEIKVVTGGYSAGDLPAALFTQWLKQNFPGVVICSFRFGPPTRPLGGSFFLSPTRWGTGISDLLIGDPQDFSTLWCANENDMFAQIPGGVAGHIMRMVYLDVTRFSFTDFGAFINEFVQTLPKIVQDLGITLPAALQALSGGLGGILGFGLPLLLSALEGLIASDPSGYDALTGTAAAALAAKIALGFLFAGTGPHIRYHIDPAWPGGPTYLDLARQHVRDWTGRPENLPLLF